MFFFKWWKSKKALREPSLEGQCHNLELIYQQINHQYFEGKIDLPIAWFGERVAKARCKVRLGSYHLEKKKIKIHRLLDQPHVPHFFISFIVYHEILHHLFPPIMVNNRRKIHHPQFKKEERRFQEYELARHFAKNNKKLWFYSFG